MRVFGKGTTQDLPQVTGFCVGNPAQWVPCQTQAAHAHVLSSSSWLQSEYFKQPFVTTLEFLDELALKDKDEKMRFFQTLSTVIGTFPSQACKYKVCARRHTSARGTALWLLHEATRCAFASCRSLVHHVRSARQLPPLCRSSPAC